MWVSSSFNAANGLRYQGLLWAVSDHPREQQMLDLSCMRQAGPVNQSLGKHVTGRRIATRNPMQ